MQFRAGKEMAFGGGDLLMGIDMFQYLLGNYHIWVTCTKIT